MGSHCTSAQVELTVLLILHSTIPCASSHYPEGKLFHTWSKALLLVSTCLDTHLGKPFLNLDTAHQSTSLFSPLPVRAQHTTNLCSNRQALPLSKAGGDQRLPRSHSMKGLCAYFWFYFPISKEIPFSTSDINIYNNVTSEKRLDTDSDVTDQIYHFAGFQISISSSSLARQA